MGYSVVKGVKIVDMEKDFSKLEAQLMNKVFLDEEPRVSYKTLEKEKKINTLEIKPCVLALAKAIHPLLLPYTKFDLSNLLERFIVKETIELAKKDLINLAELEAFSKLEMNKVQEDTQV